MSGEALPADEPTPNRKVTETTPPLFMVFDVESIGLHGQAFAVGWVVVDGDGNEHEAGIVSCPPHNAMGSERNFEWVAKNVPKLTITHTSPWQVREAFWARWGEWRGRGARLVADCTWPVEARFLAACVEDNLEGREWIGPYPLLDIPSMLVAVGEEPTQKFSRLKNEMPEHDPLADARQSARIMLLAMRIGRASEAMRWMTRHVNHFTVLTNSAGLDIFSACSGEDGKKLASGESFVEAVDRLRAAEGVTP